MQDLLPNIINQLGPDNLVNLRNIAANLEQAKNRKDADDDVPRFPHLLAWFFDQNRTDL